MEGLAAFLHGFPALCLFVSIVLGHIIGRFHFKGVGFGSVVGTLIAGIVVGILAEPELPDLLRWVFFYLFLFSIGYSVGPQFFGSLKKEAFPQIALALVVAMTGLATVLTVTALFDFSEGVAVGLLSGGMTQSAALGTGLSAIAELPIPDDLKAKLMADAPLADAITYGFGDLGLILFLTLIGPKILRADLRSEAKALEKQLGRDNDGQLFSAAHYTLRGYVVESERVAGSTIAALEIRFAEARLSVHRVRRGDETLKADPTLTLKRGDLIVVSGRRAAFVDAERGIGPEVDDPGLLSIPVATAAAVLTSRELHGKSLGELGRDPSARGVYLQSIRRGPELIPREPGTVVERGDILKIVGAPDDVERAAKHIGFVERDLSATDLAFLAGGICVGMVLGLARITAAGVALGLGTAGSMVSLSASRSLEVNAAAWALLALLAAAGSVQAQETIFIELEHRSQALPSAVNDNGSMIVGTFNGGDGFYWMPTTGVIFIGGRLASGVSADGTTIVGTAYDLGRIQTAAIWLRGTEWRLLGSFPGAAPCDFNLSAATGTSRDGSVVVGYANNGCTLTHAFRWHESTGMVDLGSSVPGQYSQALGVSGDGTVVIGRQETEVGTLVGARWRDGREELFVGPGGGPVGTAYAVNRDGSIVGGRQCRPHDPFDQSAWVWTAADGVVCLPPPMRIVHQLVINTNVQATSDDGRVMGGAQVAGGTTDQNAILWIERSPSYLKDFLRANGVPNAFATWINTGEITGISPDGRILVGYGAAIGGYRGYMVILGSSLVMP